jgi:hypothetical protein
MTQLADTVRDDDELRAMGTRVVHRGIACLEMDRPRAELARRVIGLYPVHLRARVDAAGIRTVLIGPFERYRDYSPLLARTDVDEQDIPPAGMFVAGERALYVRSPWPMVVAHEYGHAVDFALGDGAKFWSSRTRAVRRAYRAALKRKTFITPYAASALEEYVAEGMRAMVGANAPGHSWPFASQGRLRRVDPELFQILLVLLDRHTSSGVPDHGR